MKLTTQTMSEWNDRASGQCVRHRQGTSYQASCENGLAARKSGAATPDSPASAMNGEFTSYNDHK